MDLTYQVIFRPEPEGGYTVIVPALPGCITYGETLEEAKKMAFEAIQLHLEALKANNQDIVDDSSTVQESIQIHI